MHFDGSIPARTSNDEPLKPERDAAEPRRVNGSLESSTKRIPAVGSSAVLASETLPLCWIATGMQHCNHDNHIAFDGEVDCVRKALEKRATDAAA